jgi:competence protein CoiA
MLCATRKSNNQSAIAKWQSKADAPFLCPECGTEVVLRHGTARMNCFAHKSPNSCQHAGGETNDHRRCKLETYQGLLRHPGVTDVQLERPLGTVRPDVGANINGVPLAIEVQIISLSQETIIHRTKQHDRKGIYVLWLLQWTPYVDGTRYGPRLWEKWIHAAYFGRVYYWAKGPEVAPYRFEPYLIGVPESAWHSEDGKEMTAGGYGRKSKRRRTTIRDETLNLVKDFQPTQRDWWKAGDLTIPFAKLYIGRHGYSAQTFPSRKSQESKPNDPLLRVGSSKPYSFLSISLKLFPVSSRTVSSLVSER